MMKSTVLTTGAILTAVLVLAALIIIRERAEIGRLRNSVALLQAELAQLADRRVETIGRANLVEHTVNPAVVKEPSFELLQLRREVARLRSELEGVRQEKHVPIDRHASLDRLMPDDSLNEGYRAMGIESNSLPKITMGATTNDVLAELQRVGAKLLREQDKYVGPDKYIQAEFSPALIASSSDNLVTIRMEFYFDEGRLTSRRDWPKSPKTSGQ